MEFNTYCLLILGKIDNDEVKGILSKISEDDIKFLEGKGLFMATFMSVLTPSEVKDSFSGGKSVLVFKLSPDVSSVELSDISKQETLFGDIFNKFKMSEDLTETYSSMISVDKINNTKQKHINFIERLKMMSKKDRQEIADDIIDKGVENLTQEDKEILNLISKMG